MKRDVRNPFDEYQIKYDERSSCYVSYGKNEGVGYKAKVGTKKSSTMDAVPKSIKSPDISGITPYHIEVDE